MAIICIANNKGGTGKTSITLNLIHHLKPDLIIDADIHKGISNILGLGSNAIEIKHATNKQQILDWTKDNSKLIVIDCGGFDSDITRYALTQSDYTITPTSDDPTDQFALIEFNKVMKAVSKMTGEALQANILLNRIHHSRKDFKEFNDLLKGLDHLELIPHFIPQSALIPKSAFKGEAVYKGSLFIKFKEVSKNILINLL